jgi:hypothetical protein
MCLLLEVLLPGVAPDAAGEVTRAAAREGLLELRAQRRSRGARGARFFVGEPGQGCACSLAAEDADWDAPYYALRAEVAERLAQTLEFLHRRAGLAGMSVRAAWVSDRLDPLTADGAGPEAASVVFDDVRAARIANGRVYRVAPREAEP